MAVVIIMSTHLCIEAANINLFIIFNSVYIVTVYAMGEN